MTKMMKMRRLLITVSVCVLAFGLVSCGEPSGEYLPPQEESDVLSYNEALGPVPGDVAPAHSLGNDGYRYKAVKRYRLRHRRDVGEISNEYLPPVQEQGFVQEPVQTIEAAPAHTLSDDGYRYKAVKRLRYRHRRDVGEISNEYLPPVQEQGIVQEPVQTIEAAPAHTLSDDGYRYKAVKRLRYRHRRDVGEISNEYLPPVQEQGIVQEPVQTIEAAPAHTLSDDGYRYKAVKRLRYRHRRDVGEINNEYLPPVQEQGIVQEPVQTIEAAPAHTLSDDGYRYKAVKRLRYRHRRDVGEINNEYLPPVQEQGFVQEAAPAPVSISEPAPAHTLSDDGYRYKAVKRYRYRHRRDVGEINNEYLPPVQEQGFVQEAAPAPVAISEPAPAHTLSDDGYRYKAVKRYRYRHRRDVGEINNEYLPPVQEQGFVQEAAPAPISIGEPAPAHTLSDDGYRYKAVKRYRYRHRRDVSELNNEYLPPVQEQEIQVAQDVAPEPAPAHTLSNDGYRYKAVKRYRYRHRRDVSELNNEYLPPTQEVSQEYLPPVAQPAVEAAPAHTLSDDGYRYKAIKRRVFRRRY
ncbi:uncharacterized protein LOC129614045 [Condylostylus longicornis]|uniref:uncharacterized protein LOC129614045 n=1 Tax=Condylostylus longicornis TaxID=2530218 RepID=UPI00244DCD25|nr:uncharacterized protein LOC129614045 [Condylostylus longicornis]